VNELTQRTSLLLQAGHDPWLLGGAVLAALALLALGVRAAAGVAAPRGAVLVGLRAALAVSVVLLALRPALRRESVAVSAAPVAIVVDASASMGVRVDDESGATRLSRVAEWVGDHAELLDGVQDEAAVDWFVATDGGLRTSSRQEVAAGALLAAGSTDLLSSFGVLAERYPGRGRPGVLLFSDGADFGRLGQLVRDGRALGEALGPGGPIVSIPPSSTGFADLAVDLAAHDPVGFLRTEVTLRARVRSEGLAAADVPVTLRRGADVVSVKSVRVGGEAGSTGEVTFTVRPSRIGEVLYTLHVPVGSGEAVSSNNEAACSVRVVRDRLRVLQIAGRPSWDGRFLRELLKRDPAVDLISFFILRSPWDDTQAQVNELSLIPFPVDELFRDKLEGFDLVIFQNFDLGSYGIQAHLEALRAHVTERGAGLLVIGGDLAFGTDYRGAALQAVLPLAPGRTAGWQGRRVNVALTEVGARHPILRLGSLVGSGRDVGPGSGSGSAREAQASVVDALLPVVGVNVGLQVAPEGQVLLESARGGDLPLLVAGEAGEGRVLVLATDGTWRWSLPMAGRGRSPRHYEQFWGNAIRWLVNDPGVAHVVLEASRRSIGPGDSVELRARVRSESYAPEARVPVRLTVRDRQGATVREETVVTGDDGVARLPFDPPQAGLYAVEARVGDGTAGPLHVERVDTSPELSDAAVRLEVLEALAAATGGSVQDASARRPKLPFASSREERVEAAHVVPLWRTWPAWAWVAGLCCVEWWLRRRWGLA
jgi:hypothetical protein